MSDLENTQTTAPENTLGMILREKRLHLKKEISEAATFMRVKVRDVEAIENDDLEHVTKHLYVPGLIKSYAKFLRIDPHFVEEKIRRLPIKSNTENKKHQLLNIGENIDLTPDKDSFFNFLLISILMFLVLLSLYNSYEDKSTIITGKELINEMENLQNS